MDLQAPLYLTMAHQLLPRSMLHLQRLLKHLIIPLQPLINQSNHLQLLGEIFSNKIVKLFSANYIFSNTISSASNKISEVSDVVSLKKDTQTSAPVIGIIETEDNTKNPADDDGEVFYIFYENEEFPQVVLIFES